MANTSKADDTSSKTQRSAWAQLATDLTSRPASVASEADKAMEKSWKTHQDFESRFFTNEPFETDCDRRVQSPEISKNPLQNSCNIDLKKLVPRLDKSVVTLSNGRAIGSGVLACDGDVCAFATNNHVIEGAPFVSAQWDRENGHIRESVSLPVAYATPIPDIAVLPFDRSLFPDLEPVQISNSITPQKGDHLFALGHPLGLDKIVVAPGQFRSEMKNVAVGDKDNSAVLPELYETNQWLMPGNSGGPSFGEQGLFAGLSTATDGTFGYLTPAPVVKEAIERANQDHKLIVPRGTTRQTTYYDGSKFRPAVGVSYDSTTGDTRVDFGPSMPGQATAAILHKSGESEAIVGMTRIVKDKNDNVVGAYKTDGTPIYTVERDEQGIKRLTKYDQAGRPHEIFERQSVERNHSREAFISDHTVNDVLIPDATTPRLDKLSGNFNLFYVSDAMTGAKTSILPMKMNLNITADGVLRTETPEWFHMITGQRKVTYEAPGRSLKAEDTRDQSTLWLSGGIVEQFDKNLDQTKVSWTTLDGKELRSLSNVAFTRQSDQAFSALSINGNAIITKDGHLFENTGGGSVYRVYDRQSEKLLAITNTVGEKLWEFNDTNARRHDGLDLQSSEWKVASVRTENDGTVTIASVDGTARLRIRTNGEAVIERNDGTLTNLAATDVFTTAKDNKLVRVRVAHENGQLTDYTPVFDGDRIIALQSAKETKRLEPVDANYRFDPDTGRIITGSEKKGSVTYHREWNLARNQYEIVREEPNTMFSGFQLDTDLVNQGLKLNRYDPRLEASRFKNMNDEEIVAFSRNTSVPNEDRRVGYQEILRRIEFSQHTEALLKSVDSVGTVLTALAKNRELKMTPDGKVTIDAHKFLSDDRRLAFHEAVLDVLGQMNDRLNVGLEYSKFLKSANIDDKTDSYEAATKKLLNLGKTPISVNGKKETLVELMKQEYTMLSSDGHRLNQSSLLMRRDVLDKLEKNLTGSN